ncbi:hypothetical protein Glove_4g2 [Diversispora epigaea]|uniref:Uncharacterized protein n=1 Tax=Diversispora epigaea TaxID=1348612 RepID=A0A397JQK2_9GLOM|nr:hypothetical protein Glove_4g2 [Diversispora epigaea]
MVNTGTNIQLVSCDRIQISDVGNKRTCEKENETPSKKVINNNPSLNQDVDEDHGEMASSENPIVKRLTEVDGIAQYKIVFLPEENDCDPVKSIFNKEKWVKLETDWQKTEAKTMLPVDCGMNKNAH